MRVASALLSLAGCSPSDGADDRRPGDAASPSVKDTGEEIAPVVGLGQVIGFELPDDSLASDLAFATPYFPAGAVARVYVAESESPAGLQTGLLSGAVADLWGGIVDVGMGEVSSPGEYVLIDTNRAGWAYTDQAHAAFRIYRWWLDHEAWIHFDLPSSAYLDLPTQHATNAPLVLDVTGQGYRSTVVIVYDATGVQTWTNDPADVAAMHDALHAPQVEQVEIPGAAFSGIGTYLVGFAGMTHGPFDQVEGTDSTVSAARAGRMRFWTVEVVTGG